MNFGFTAEAEKIRSEVRSFLEKEVTPDLVKEITLNTGATGSGIGRKLVQKMGARGWLCPTWPKKYGGLNYSEVIGFIIRDEMAYAGGPVSLIGATMAGPSILKFATEEMKKQYLPRIARGEIEMILGYTEPQAGSDLASLEMRAEDKGDYFLINGQKMFNTHAHFAEYHWLGARTDTSAPKHKGISLIIVDMKSPGITVRPMTTITGGKTNEVFYDNVKVPKKNLVGETNRGFYYIMTALDFERMFPFGGMRRILDELLSYTKETKQDGEPLSKNPIIRQKLAQIAIEIEVTYSLYYQLAYMLDNEQIPNFKSAMQKVFASEAAYRTCDVATQIMGSRGQLQSGSKWAPLDGDAELHYRWSIIEDIYGGTSEIQRNIIALRGLGLPAH